MFLPKTFPKYYGIINCIIFKSFFNGEKRLDFTKQYLSEIFLISTVQKQPAEVLFNKRLPTNFAKFTGKHLGQSLFFNKVAGLRSATLLKNRLSHSCFPVDFAKFLRTPFLQNTSGRLLQFGDTL